MLESLFSNRFPDHLRAVQSLLRLSGKFGGEKLEAACVRALRFGSPIAQSSRSCTAGIAGKSFALFPRAVSPVRILPSSSR